MREVSTPVTNAILSTSSVKMRVKAAIDPSRTFFTSVTHNNPYDGGDYSQFTDTPVGQCVTYSPTQDKAYTFIIDSSSGEIYCMESGSSTKHNLSLTANKETKPSAVEQGNGTVKLYYWNNSPSELRVSTVNLSTFGVSGTTQVTISSVPSGYGWTIEAGSPTAIDDNTIILCYKTSKGGIGVVLKESGSWHHWSQRFMSAKTLSDTVWTIYTSGVPLGDYFYIYATDIDSGAVKAVQYNQYGNTWSDTFIALPADFSRFDIANALVINGYVHLAGQFHRTGDYEEAKVYSLILRSLDGRSFSWDKFTELSSLGYRFHISPDTANKKIYASDRNSVGIADMSYFFTTTPTNRLSIDPPGGIIDFTCNGNQGTLVISNSDETVGANAVVAKGNRVTVWVGYSTSDYPEGEYTKYNTFIIDKKSTVFADGKRALSLTIVNEAIWKTDKIAFPFYSEILSKSSLYDDCSAQDKMYVAPCFSGDHLDYMTIDFWNSDEWDGDGEVSGTPFSWCDFPQSGTQVTTFTGTILGKTCNLNAHPFMTSYPEIIGTFTAALYGWEHTEESSRPNSTFTLYAITAPEDDLTDKTVTQGTLTSTYQKFPQKYPDTESGDYPITFSFSGIDVGHKLLYFGISCANANAGTSEMNLERIEVEDVQFIYSQLTASTAWELDRPTGESRDYLVSPDTCLQNLMFTTKPYSSMNFNISAEFGYSEGDAPLGTDTVAWGVVGLAKDGYDYFCARYRRTGSILELCIFRNGKCTVLADYSTSAVYDIMLDHRGGLFRVWYKSTDTWIGPVITYQYDETTYGTLSTSDTGIMHTGIYSAVYPPGFLACAFAQPYSDGICLLTDQDKSILSSFPSSGTVWLNGVKYSYSNKTTNLSTATLAYGPHQLRQVTNIGTWEEGGTTYSGIGCEIACYHPTLAADVAENLLLGQSNFHNWLITQSDWTVEHSTGGSPDYLRNRSKHYSEAAISEKYYAASIFDRCYINHGLLGIERLSDQPYKHPHGALCSSHGTDKIWVKKVVATQVDRDATIKDMLTMLCGTASVEAEFPGDWTTPSAALTTGPTPLAETETIFPGGCDIRFRATLGTDGVRINASNLILTDTSESYWFGFKGSGGIIQAFVETSSSTIKEYINSEESASIIHDFRILVHDDFITFYVDNLTIATFALGVENLDWDDDALTLNAYAVSSITITNVMVCELFDWREATYVESEMSASSAIMSVIQERPIDIFATDDGNLSFGYNFERSGITYTTLQSKQILRRHEKHETHSRNAGSDAMVYYADIAFVNNIDYANEEGFNTRVFKLPSLDFGAKLAGKLILEKAYEKEISQRFIMRPDIRVQEGDTVTFNYELSGTGTTVTASAIVESVNIAIREGDYSMGITARGDLT